VNCSSSERSNISIATMGDGVNPHPGSSTLLTNAGEDRSPRAWYQRSLEVLNELRASRRTAGGPLDDDEPQLIATIERKLATRH
jgi:hypothetical protein